MGREYKYGIVRLMTVKRLLVACSSVSCWLCSFVAEVAYSIIWLLDDRKPCNSLIINILPPPKKQTHYQCFIIKLTIWQLGKNNFD